MAETQRYKIIERLDAGGMAEVFRGVAESAVGGFKKSVAIKRILPNLTKNTKFVSMFLDEARLSLHLQHANVVQVFDIGDRRHDVLHRHGVRRRREPRRSSRTRCAAGTHASRSRTRSTSSWRSARASQYAHDVHDPETGKPLGHRAPRHLAAEHPRRRSSGEVKLVDFGLAKATSQLENDRRRAS